MKKALLILFTAFLLLSLCGCCLSHKWQNASCETPQTCSECGKTKGEALGHSWQEVTCAAPKTCTVCGTTEGDALPHTWQDATCAAPKTCSECGATEGNSLEHSWNEATCETPQTCADCATTEGEAPGHKLINGTVTWNEDGTSLISDATCSVCGTKALEKSYKGIAQLPEDILVHDWVCSFISMNGNLYNPFEDDDITFLNDKSVVWNFANKTYNGTWEYQSMDPNPTEEVSHALTYRIDLGYDGWVTGKLAVLEQGLWILYVNIDSNTFAAYYADSAS